MWNPSISQVDVVVVGAGDDPNDLGLDARAWSVLGSAVGALNQAAAGLITYGAPRAGPLEWRDATVYVRYAPNDPDYQFPDNGRFPGSRTRSREIPRVVCRLAADY
jgi:hypothetical protein